jgi:hypothetical protein
LTQTEFLKRIGFDVCAVQNRVQKSQKPDHSARVLLERVIARESDAVSSIRVRERVMI